MEEKRLTYVMLLAEAHLSILQQLSGVLHTVGAVYSPLI